MHLLFHVATGICKIIIVITIKLVQHHGQRCRGPNVLGPFRSLGNSIFLFFVFGRKCRAFLSSFIFRPKQENPFTVGLYPNLIHSLVSCISYTTVD